MEKNKKRGRGAKVYPRGNDVVFLSDFLKAGLPIKYQTVHNLLSSEVTGKNLKPKSKRTYLGYLRAVCKILKKNPDRIILDIKTAKNPNLAIKRNHRKVARAIAKRELMIRTTDLRFLTLIRFYKCNGIKVSGELKHELKLIVAKAYKPAFKRAVYA